MPWKATGGRTGCRILFSLLPWFVDNLQRICISLILLSYSSLSYQNNRVRDLRNFFQLTNWYYWNKGIYCIIRVCRYADSSVSNVIIQFQVSLRLIWYAVYFSVIKSEIQTAFCCCATYGDEYPSSKIHYEF